MLAAGLCGRYGDRRAIDCQGPALHITAPDENTDWRDVVEQICLWALPRSDDELDRENLRRTLAQLDLIDQATCQVLAMEWLHELTTNQTMH